MMNRKVKLLIAYDGSACAADAIGDLRRAGLPAIADALVVNVSEVWLPLPRDLESKAAAPATAFSANNPVEARSAVTATKVEFVTSHKGAGELVNVAAERLRSFFPEWQVETETLRGSPSSVILRRAADWNADLIVAGCQGRGEKSHPLLGSVSQKLANEAPCSIRITRSHGVWKNGSPLRILIALDGSRAANAAVAEVSRRSWIPGSEVRLIVVRDYSGAVDSDKLSVSTRKEISQGTSRSLWIAEFVERARKALLRAELQISELIEEGDPKQLIVAEAEEWGADCIFIGSCSDEEGNRLLGSVSTAVVARAHCSVEIVRPKRTLAQDK